MSSRLDFVHRAHAADVQEQYARYRRDPSSVGEEWALFFAGFDLSEDPSRRPGAGASTQGGVFGLVHAYREFGHLVANLNPLGGNLENHPLLALESFGLTEADLDREVDPRPFQGDFRGTLRELIGALRATYCGSLGVEYMDIPDTTRRTWFQERMESMRNQPRFGPESRVEILRGLLEADAFEQFLHVKYVGQKRFSLEGAATLIPM